MRPPTMSMKAVAMSTASFPKSPPRMPSTRAVNHLGAVI